MSLQVDRLIFLAHLVLVGFACADIRTIGIENPSCGDFYASLNYSEFKDKVIVVTGGASGIGYATSQLLGVNGAKVIILDRALPEGMRASESIAVQFRQTDIVKESEIEAALREILGEHHRIDGLVANAGVHASGSILDTTSAEFSAVMDVNLTGTFNSVRHFVQAMTAHTSLPFWGKGNIVVTGSDQSLIGKPRSTAYGMSKTALAGMVRSAAPTLLSEDIRINLVCPGTTDTLFLDAAVNNHSQRYGLDPTGMKESWANAMPGRRMVTAMEVAHSILMYLSPRSSGTTGALIPVDRGYTAQ